MHPRLYDKNNKKKKGFTLTELLVSVATIGVLAGMLMPVLHKARLRARDASCLTQQRNLFIGLESAFNEAIPDFTIKEDGSQNEINNELSRIFVQDYIHPLVKDHEFNGLGVYVSSPLTCPYSSGNGKGKARAPFRAVPMKEFPEEWQTPRFSGVRYFTYNYGFDVEHLRLDRDGNQEVAVIDMPNYRLKEKTTVGDWFSGVADDKSTEDYASQSISFDSSLLHPHKGRGMYATFGSGEQRWVSDKELHVTSSDIEKAKE